MGVIGIIILAWVTTAIVGMYEVVHPVMNQLTYERPDDLMVQYKYLTYFVFFGMAMLTAPALLGACLMPKAGETFRAALLEAIKG